MLCKRFCIIVELHKNVKNLRVKFEMPIVGDTDSK